MTGRRPLKIDEYGPILKFVIEQGSPFPFPHPWGFLRSRDCVNPISPSATCSNFAQTGIKRQR